MHDRRGEGIIVVSKAPGSTEGIDFSVWSEDSPFYAQITVDALWKMRGDRAVVPAVSNLPGLDAELTLYRI